MAEAFDGLRPAWNRSYGLPLDYSRPPDAVRRQFGVTELVFEYARNFPDTPDTGYGKDGTEPIWAYTRTEYWVEKPGRGLPSRILPPRDRLHPRPDGGVGRKGG